MAPAVTSNSLPKSQTPDLLAREVGRRRDVRVLPRHRQRAGPLEDLGDVHEVRAGLAGLQDLGLPGDRELRAVRLRADGLRERSCRRRTPTGRRGSRPRSSPARSPRNSPRTGPADTTAVAGEPASAGRRRSVRVARLGAWLGGATDAAPLGDAASRRTPTTTKLADTASARNRSHPTHLLAPRGPPTVPGSACDACHGMTTRSIATTAR